VRRNLLVLTATFLTMTTLTTPPSPAEERAGILKWNTADLYPTEDAWAAAKAGLTARIPKLAQYQGKLGESPERFYAALNDIFETQKDLSRLQVYASMRADEDTRVAKSREMNQSADQLGVQFAATVSYLRPEILALGEGKVMGFVAQDERLTPYRPVLDDILRYAPHTLSAAEEKVAATAALMGDNAQRAYSTFTNADLPYPEVTLSTGERVRLDASAYTQYRAAPNRADRDKVFEAFWNTYRGFERTLGTTLDGHVKVHMVNQQVHKFASCLEAALFDSNVPVTVYHQLISDVHANLPTLHRYLKLREKMMGVDKIRYEDLYAPIVKEVDLKYTPEQAMDLVLKATAPLGPDYVNVLEQSFDDRWVDWIPTTGKRSGAYSTGVYGVHPYQLQNFTGLYEEVSTLAHESGHSMHTFLSDKTQPYATHDYKIFVAEVASTLNENLLLEYMLRNTNDRETKLFLLGSYLDGLRTTLFRQTLFAEFELKFHELAEKGEPLTGEKLSTTYLGLLKTYYGDKQGVCGINDRYAIEWAYIPHFYYNFYVYQYATSITASSMLAANMRAEAAQGGGTKARDAYIRLLSSGSSKYPIDLLKDAGVDMTTSAPFRAAIDQMNAIMDQMETLLGWPTTKPAGP